MTKPENKYKHGSIIWSVMEGDWEDLTVSEIAEVLDVSEAVVQDAIQRIGRETGRAVRYSGAEPEEMANGENFSDRLRMLRRRKGLSGQALGELCGLGKNVILCYEKEERIPRMDSLVALADYFDVSTDYLIGRTNNPQRLL